MKILAAALLALALACAVRAAQVGPGYDILMSRLIPVRDGVELEAWITRPSHLSAPAPAILTLTQYDIDGSRRGEPPYFAQRGYVWVQAYVRGRGRSGGVKSDNLGLTVGRDGYDLIEWIARQPWSNGQVVMYGGSFVGMTQWHTAAQRPPHLAAIAPYVPIYPGWDVPNTNGIPQAWTTVILGYTAGRALNPGFIENPGYWSGKLLEHYAAQQPFGELDAAMGIAADDWWMSDASGARAPMLRVWLDHVGEEAFNLAAEPRDADYAAMPFPVLTGTGFFDDDQPGALRYYARHGAHAPPAALARSYLVIGPWDHGGTQVPAAEIAGLRIPANAVPRHEEAARGLVRLGARARAAPGFFHDRVAYYMMGANEWRYAHTLAAAGSGRQLVLHLATPGGTADLAHPGVLAAIAPRREPATLLVSDPRELPELAVAQEADEENLLSQFRARQQRAVVFESAPLAADTEMAGALRLLLACTADTPDYDLWAQVLLVQADGSAVRLGEDIRRARFRNSPFTPSCSGPESWRRSPSSSTGRRGGCRPVRTCAS